ncbi:nucleoside triphosphate pyrophosphohydrolase [Anaerobium acetethylicum]|uniref:Tetrapyrrole methylase family protein / MazG family protein n=1 Tax=Anaerobium acetethylicum TaxID=1619234 RepID=A0A1D3TYM7_9FIRM|nr:nucleoside triphosphate pyrophosphohydrolase [Anaerobium acetethylicum]SCP99577.1 tetrapyrrole methylase family protein / MazG family protein [Anaerobium acetethylicum]
MKKKKYSYEDLLEIVQTLRGVNGCPWDREQTHESLKTCLIEECYEVIEAIDNRDDENLCEELGDVLLQVVMHSQIASEGERFGMDEVIDGISRKLVRRHPHVFGEKKAADAGEVLKNWDEIKRLEKISLNRPEKPGELSGVPKAFPSVIRAQKIQKKAEKTYKFHSTSEENITRIEGLASELKQQAGEMTPHELEKAIGEILFESINLAKNLGVNAENSLTNVTETFINKLESTSI